jgi:hypothetical protein
LPPKLLGYPGCFDESELNLRQGKINSKPL